jgi:DNA-binding transcriptional LysR family regulator
VTDLALSELRILDAVERTGSLTAAGAALGLTQSAVSHAVRTTERKVGVVLFERGRRGATPTPAGARAVAHARHILRLLETLGPEARGAATGTLTGPLRIVAFRAAAAHLLPGVLRRLAARHPELVPEVRVVPDLGPGIAGEVADGRADLGIATLGGSQPPGLLSAHLFDETYALASPAGRADPRGLPLVDWAENCSSYTRQWWATQDWLPTARINAGDDSVVLSMVARGLGLAIMPELALRDAPPTITVTDLGPDRPHRAIGYLTTPELATTHTVRALIRELRATAPRVGR